MVELTTTFRRNLFEIENARNLTREEVVRTFVPPQSFWRLLSPKNHILLGSRGSGKTAIAKMLSHDHLSLWDQPRAQKAIGSKTFVGMYLPTRLEWVGGLRNKPWQTTEEREAYFCWRLNVASCLAFLNAAESCLRVYFTDDGARASAERSLCLELRSAWIEEDREVFTVENMREYLDDVEYRKQQQLARERALGGLPQGEQPVGMYFDVDLFAPLRRAISIGAKIFQMPADCAWLLCLDEAEFLKEEHQRILNSHMRGYSANLFFKMTTMPYAHHGAATTTDVSLDAGHDFDYVYLDPDPVFQAKTDFEHGRIGTRFARTLFGKRAEASNPRFARVSVTDLLGPSELLDPRPEDWRPSSPNMKLLERYASSQTVARAGRLARSKAFMDEIARKIQGALLLRHKVQTQQGRQALDAYSGASMAMRCGDANPRRLIRIFNAMLLAAPSRRYREGTNVYKVPSSVSTTRQTEVLIHFSDQTLASVQSEPQFGRDLYELLTQIGEFMKHSLYDLPLTTDQVSSVKIDRHITDKDWDLIQRAVAIGLLYPNINPNSPDELPLREGTFHLAYALAPHFRLLPRRGKARTLATIRQFARTATTVVPIHVNLSIRQKRLFTESEED